MINVCLRNLQRNLQLWLFPPICVLCGKPGEGERDLCADCLADLPYNTHACRRCARPLQAITDTICGQCLRAPPAYDRSFSLFHYTPPVDRLILRLKFNANLHLARLLGELMAGHLAEHSQTVPELIIPVPLHHSRLRERGYNQALEIARPIAKKLAIPIDYRSCARLRPTSAQSLLPAKERHGNVKGAFGVIKSIGAHHIAIIDDVMTTGHTLQEVATELRKSGVETIDVWVLARTSLNP